MSQFQENFQKDGRTEGQMEDNSSDHNLQDPSGNGQGPKKQATQKCS